MKVLVINAGSSSCKYQLLEMDTETVLASGLAERIGQGMGKLTHKIAPDSDHEEKIVRESAFPTHVEAMELVISLLTSSRTRAKSTPSATACCTAANPSPRP